MKKITELHVNNKSKHWNCSIISKEGEDMMLVNGYSYLVASRGIYNVCKDETHQSTER